MKLNLVSLGCARNRVDSEIMLGRLAENGWDITAAPEEADVIIVNTCSFIRSAVDESIDTILELADYKNRGHCKRLVITGCLPERFREDLADSMPEADIFLGTGAYDQIVAVLAQEMAVQQTLLPDPGQAPLQTAGTPRILTQPYTAYIKIAEGCSRHCTYCMIPRLRGRQRSRDLEDIVAEARQLATVGIKELVLIAQDTTAYGQDLKSGLESGLESGNGLADLLERLAVVDEHIWIRFLYGHPESMTDRIAEAVAAHANICAYFDIPVQHAADGVLKRMGRHYGHAELLKLFEGLRHRMPEAVLRTTVMVGFPGETRTDFKELMQFIETIAFDHLGAFIYSDAEELPASRLTPKVTPKTARARRDRLMTRQADIALERNRQRVGKTYPVLLEGTADDGRCVGRAIFQAPEVDGLVYVTGQQTPPGQIVEVKITRALPYDLEGEIV